MAHSGTTGTTSHVLVTYDDLLDVALNLRWTWKQEARQLFAALDPHASEGALEWPHQLIRGLGRAAVTRALEMDPRLAQLASLVVSDLRSNIERESTAWFPLSHRRQRHLTVAYFAAEFSLSDSLPIFAGGLGTVAGEQLKASSALGVPLFGVGLLYRGSSHQWIDDAGLQHESWDMIDPSQMPIDIARDRRGRAIQVPVELPGRTIQVAAYRARVGRRSLFLLDTVVDSNSVHDRSLTARLYDNDVETRFSQELILGIGGLRVLSAAGIAPDILHLNEGHSAFAALEQIRRCMARDGLTFSQARVAAAPSLVFTTHTPVAAGHDYFAPEIASTFLEPYARSLGVDVDEIVKLGRYRPDDPTDTLCPTVFALRCCGRRNGVSRLHGAVTREQWGGLWPRLPTLEVPIGHVTNGVHLQSWTALEFDELLTSTLGAEWQTSPGDRKMWDRLQKTEASDVWDAKNAARERLVRFTRRRAREELQRRHASLERVTATNDLLSPQCLTIGFVGRFVAYKRPTLLLHDPDRLARILRNPDRPMQIVFAGKAHPNDEGGKRLLQGVIEFAERYDLASQVAFIADFDTTMDRALAQGVDVWLNTPRRPLEACGVGGMKAGMNGALNFSTLDGWWDEACHDADPSAPAIGFTIGTDGPYIDDAHQDLLDATSLYNALEFEIGPRFYDRDDDGIPLSWLASVTESMTTLAPTWNSLRMTREYVESYYLPGYEDSRRLTSGGARLARSHAREIERLRRFWPATSLSVRALATKKNATHVTIDVDLAELAPADVVVQAWCDDAITAPTTFDGTFVERVGSMARYDVILGATVPDNVVIAGRLIPSPARFGTDALAGLITWSSSD